NYDPETFQTTLTNSVISDTARAGVILEHVAADVSANELMDCTLASDDGVSMFYQDSASVSGEDEMVELAEGGVMEPLSLYRDSVEMDLLDN
ncbi:MAG: hypothetical protein QGG40_22520, partial [Myxococcota bacterium]|nr:hypothetical protein [Myxococcota bacterium]